MENNSMFRRCCRWRNLLFYYLYYEFRLLSNDTFPTPSDRFVFTVTNSGEYRWVKTKTSNSTNHWGVDVSEREVDDDEVRWDLQCCACGHECRMQETGLLADVSQRDLKKFSHLDGLEPTGLDSLSFSIDSALLPHAVRHRLSKLVGSIRPCLVPIMRPLAWHNVS